LTVGELAQRLGITHAAVSQVRTALEAEGLILSKPDPRDGRRQRLMLSAKGQRTATRLAPLWAAIASAANELMREGAPTLMENLDGLDQALERRGLRSRAGALLGLDTVDDTGDTREEDT